MSGVSENDARSLAAELVGNIEQSLRCFPSRHDQPSYSDADVTYTEEGDAEIVDYDSLQAIAFEEFPFEKTWTGHSEPNNARSKTYANPQQSNLDSRRGCSADIPVSTSLYSDEAPVRVQPYRVASSPQEIPGQLRERSQLNPNSAVFTPKGMRERNGSTTPNIRTRSCSTCGNGHSVSDNWCDDCGSAFPDNDDSDWSPLSPGLQTHPSHLNGIKQLSPLSDPWLPQAINSSLCSSFTGLGLDTQSPVDLRLPFETNSAAIGATIFRPPCNNVPAANSLPINPFYNGYPVALSPCSSISDAIPCAFPFYSVSLDSTPTAVPQFISNSVNRHNRHGHHASHSVPNGARQREMANRNAKVKQTRQRKSRRKTDSGSPSRRSDNPGCLSPWQTKFGADARVEAEAREESPIVAVDDERPPFHACNGLVPRINLAGIEDYDELLTLIRTDSHAGFPCLRLPEEVIYHILSFLSIADLVRCCRVCRQFNFIASEDGLWKKKSIRLSCRKIHNDILVKAAKKLPSSFSLSQCDCKTVTSDGVEEFFKLCGSGLKEFSVGNCNNGLLPNVPILRFVVPHSRSLTSIDLSWCSIDETNAKSLADNVLRLEVLRLNGCQELSDGTIQHICHTQGESLKVLELFGCFKLSNAAMYHVAENCRNLQTLKIGQCHKICESGVDHIIWKSVGLQELDLRGVKKLVDNAVKKIANNLLSLSTLVLANCPLISDAAVLAVAERMHMIRVLDVCGCGRVTDRSMQELAACCSMIESLDVSSTKVTSSSVSALANGSCKKLISLKLSFCSKITLSSLAELVTRRKSLRLLHLFGCKGVANPTQLTNINPSLDIQL